MKAIINNRRIAGIICLIIMIGLMATPAVLADTNDQINANAGAQTAKPLKMVQSYPEDNSTRLQMENTGIKLFFDGNVIDKSVWKNNQKCFTLTTKKGKAVKVKAYSSQKSGTDYILVVADKGQTLKSKADYIFTIKAGLKSTEGQTLEEDIVLNYTTIDMDGNMRINMGLMALMVVGMIVMTVVSNKRKEHKQEVKKEEKVNPYKVAKEKGKSVEEVIEKIEKDKAKKAKKLKGKGNDGEDDDEDEEGVYKVKRVRRVSDGGSTYKTGRKALAEKKAKEEAAKKAKGTTNPKKSKKKGKKKK